MARPLARRHTIKVRLTDEELATLEARARGAALAPSIAAAALGTRRPPGGCWRVCQWVEAGGCARVVTVDRIRATPRRAAGRVRGMQQG